MARIWKEYWTLEKDGKKKEMHQDRERPRRAVKDDPEGPKERVSVESETAKEPRDATPELSSESALGFWGGDVWGLRFEGIYNGTLECAMPDSHKCERLGSLPCLAMIDDARRPLPSRRRDAVPHRRAAPCESPNRRGPPRHRPPTTVSPQPRPVPGAAVVCKKIFFALFAVTVERIRCICSLLVIGKSPVDKCGQSIPGNAIKARRAAKAENGNYERHKKISYEKVCLQDDSQEVICIDFTQKLMLPNIPIQCY
ncbi:hypothetical protein ABEB36_014823 [Hypothenemus hampei]|uniref:Uncharacterized protein n=1 Tax=Hypothenemus hampei TaxID=57062 RepID=A0ABD1E0Y9_HYPHA